MENNSNNNLSKFAIPLVAVVIIIVAVVAIYASTNNSTTTITPSQNSTETQDTTQQAADEQSSEYKDGIYSAQGTYVSPGGSREIGLTITLENGVVTDTTFEGNAQDPQSKRFQGEFGDNYAPLIVGKDINDVTLTKVSGSSLTPKGFTDALEKIKTQAQS
jgi:uncharacterized protein with FMN-binding domain